jgi:hypothetical protein
MSTSRFRWIGLALIAVAVGSCATDESLTGPPEPESSLIGTLLRPTGLLSCSPLPYASTTATVGPSGGIITVGPHELRIPPGALAEPVTITAEAPSGTVNLVRFQPEGLEFRSAARLTMSYANCNTLGLLIPKRIAYTTDALVILEYLLSLDNLWAQKVTGRLEHFSSYAIAW